MQNKLLLTFAKYVSLNVLGMIGLSCYILADTFFISAKMGANGLTALNLALPVYSLINGLGLMLGVGGGTKFALLKTEHKHICANATFTNSLFAGGVIGLVITVAGVLFSQNLSTALGANAESFDYTNIYLKTIMCFAPCFIVNNIVAGFVRNNGSPKLAMIAMLCASFSNIVLDYVFVFPFNMGMFGAAFATGLAPVFSLCVLSLHFKQNKGLKAIKCKLKLKTIKQITTLGVSSFITEISSGIVMLVFNMVLLGISGNVAVAAYGVVANIALVGISVFVGVAQGMQPVLTTSFGKNNIKEVKSIYKYGVATALAFAIIIYIIILIFALNIVDVFNSQNNLALKEMAVVGMYIYFMGFFFGGINIVRSAALSAIKQPKPAFLISLLRGCSIIIPIVILLGLVFGITGVWVAYPLVEGVAFGVGVWLIARLRCNNHSFEGG